MDHLRNRQTEFYFYSLAILCYRKVYTPYSSHDNISDSVQYYTK